MNPGPPWNLTDLRRIDDNPDISTVHRHEMFRGAGGDHFATTLLTAVNRAAGTRFRES
jgi:hypothetical protein